MKLGIVHKEKRERLQDKNRIIAELNKKIMDLNQEILVLRCFNKEEGVNLPPLFISVLEDKGTHIEVKTVIRQSRIRSGYEVLVV